MAARGRHVCLPLALIHFARFSRDVAPGTERISKNRQEEVIDSYVYRAGHGSLAQGFGWENLTELQLDSFFKVVPAHDCVLEVQGVSATSWWPP